MSRKWCGSVRTSKMIASPIFLAMMFLILTIGICGVRGNNKKDNDAPLFAAPNYGEKDKLLVLDIERKAKKLSGKGKTTLLESTIEKMQSPSLRARSLISLAQLYEESGSETKAESSLLKAYSDYQSTGMGMLAADHLLTLYHSKGNFAKGANFAAQVLTSRWLTLDQTIHFTCRLAELLAANHETKNAVAALNQLAEKHPGKIKRIAKSYEEVSVTSMIWNDIISYNKGMEWINKNAPTYANDPRFLGNYAHSCQVSGQIKAAIAVRQRIEKDFPTDVRATENLFELGNLLMKNGNWKEAAACYRKLIKINEGDERLKVIQQISRNNLASMNSKAGFPLNDRTPPKTKSSTRRMQNRWRIAGGVFIIIGVLLLAMRVRRKFTRV